MTMQAQEVPTTSDARIKVLVADDSDTDRLILSSIISGQGHAVVTAADGQEAVEVFEKERPHIVLLDAMMPRMDGKDAARYIKKAAGEDFIPVLFLTSLSDANDLAECLDAGGDDFLSKPYSKVILQAKLNAFLRMRSMHATLQAQHFEISQHHEHLLQEQKVAKAVFDNVAHSGALDLPNIKYLLSPLAMFNGDVLLAAQKPSGGMHVMLGDFTGHGLPAAIGAMPMAEVFYYMTTKGYGLPDIVAEINLKLKSVLPVGVFCCACMADFSFEKQIARIWSGGLPDQYLYRKQTGKLEVIKSQHLPLGIRSADEFSSEFQVFEMTKGDRFIVCSDGILESVNESGDMYGEERLLEAIESAGDDEEIFGAIEKSVADFIGSSDHTDDVTLLEFKMLGDFEIQNTDTSFVNAAQIGPQDWSLQYELGPRTLRDFNPLPLMLQIIMEVPGLRSYSGQVYTILAELFSNALEHGVLGLSSSMKSTAAGFMEYYESRTKLLDALQSGFVRFGIKHVPTEVGGVLIIKVEDSGSGFDYAATVGKGMSRNNYEGRGVPLVRSLCDSLGYSDEGRCVEVSYVWQYD